jgi:hypothetical protein
MFITLGRLICRAPWRVVLGAALLVFVAALYGMDVMERLTLAPGWDVPGSGSAEVVKRIKEQQGVDETPVIVLFSPKPGAQGDVDSPDIRRHREIALCRFRQSRCPAGHQLLQQRRCPLPLARWPSDLCHGATGARRG